MIKHLTRGLIVPILALVMGLFVLTAPTNAEASTLKVQQGADVRGAGADIYGDTIIFHYQAVKLAPGSKIVVQLEKCGGGWSKSRVISGKGTFRFSLTKKTHPLPQYPGARITVTAPGYKPLIRGVGWLLKGKAHC